MNDKRQRNLLAAATILGMTALTACNPPANDQHLQEQAAQATEQAKQGSKEALADAQVDLRMTSSIGIPICKNLDITEGMSKAQRAIENRCRSVLMVSG